MLKITLVIYSNGNSPLKAERTLIDAIAKIPGIIAVTPHTEKLEGELIDTSRK